MFIKDEDGEIRWKDLQSRIIEHNIRVIAKCFTRIRTQRMADHLDLSLENMEKHVSELVVKGQIWARIGKSKLSYDLRIKNVINLTVFQILIIVIIVFPDIISVILP